VAWHKTLPLKHKKNWHGSMHSHNSMSVFASHDDEKTIASLMATMPWCLTIITNHKAEIYCRVDIKFPVYMTKKDIPLIILPNDNVLSKCRKELESKCTEKAWPTVSKPVSGRIGMGDPTIAASGTTDGDTKDGGKSIAAACKERLEDLQLMKDYEAKHGITHFDEKTKCLIRTFPDGRTEIVAYEVGNSDDGSGLLEGGGDDKPLSLSDMYST